MSTPPPRCYLFDNGSLRADSTLNLRSVATALSTTLGETVAPVSLLHSSGVPSEQLGGLPAQLLEPALTAHLLEDACADLVLLPFFFGPSGALTRYLPERLESLRARFPKATLRQASPLCPQPDRPEPEVVLALVDATREVIRRNNLRTPEVVLVDHGSPQRAVTQVRDILGTALAARLGSKVAGVRVASMERKEGDEFAFNEPLLARRLRTVPCAEGDVVVLLQFLSPGRHAGVGGDIETICREAMADQPHLRIHMSDTIGASPHLLPLLVRRYAEARGRAQ